MASTVMLRQRARAMGLSLPIRFRLPMGSLSTAAATTKPSFAGEKETDKEFCSVSSSSGLGGSGFHSMQVFRTVCQGRSLSGREEGREVTDRQTLRNLRKGFVISNCSSFRCFASEAGGADGDEKNN